MKKVGIAGNMLVDVVKMIDVWPEKGMLVNIGKNTRAVGGCVCNTAIDLKRLAPQLAVSVYGKVGKDEYGEYLLEQMQSAGLDCSAVRKTATSPTSYSDVMTVQTSGERTFFHCRGANAELALEDIPVEKLDCDLFHLGYLLLLDKLDEADEEYQTKAARLLHDVQARGVKTSIDLVSEQSDRFTFIVIPALKYCDYVVINEIEASRISGVEVLDEEGKISLTALKKACERILAYGVRECVVVHCTSLSCSLDKDGVFEAVGSLQLPKDYIVGAVGAGDAFCAGMLYAFVEGLPLVEGMKLASCAAACNLAVADSVSGAKDAATALQLEKKFKRRSI